MANGGNSFSCLWGEYEYNSCSVDDFFENPNNYNVYQSYSSYLQHKQDLGDNTNIDVIRMLEVADKHYDRVRELVNDTDFTNKSERVGATKLVSGIYYSSFIDMHNIYYNSEAAAIISKPVLS